MEIVREIVGEAQAILLRLARQLENQWSERMSVSGTQNGHPAIGPVPKIAYARVEDIKAEFYETSGLLVGLMSYVDSYSGMICVVCV